jgi:hypothetical protein
MLRSTFLAAIGTAGCVSLTALRSIAQENLSLFGVVTYGHEQQPREPLSGLFIFLIDESGLRIGPSIPTDDGRFAFFDVPAGRYHIEVQDSGEKTIWRSDVTLPQQSRSEPYSIVLE